MLFHVVGQFGQLVSGHAQRFGGLLAHGGNHFVVEVLDEFRGFLLDPLRRFADRLAGASCGFFYFAIEVVHSLIISCSGAGVNRGASASTRSRVSGLWSTGLGSWFGVSTIQSCGARRIEKCVVECKYKSKAVVPSEIARLV